MTITASTDDKKIMYKLTRDRKRKPMKQAPDVVEVQHYAFYTDLNKATGEVAQLVTIMDNNGDMFTTNSATFIDDFAAIVDAFPDVERIRVERMTSKKNREFLTCSMDD